MDDHVNAKVFAFLISILVKQGDQKENKYSREMSTEKLRRFSGTKKASEAKKVLMEVSQVDPSPSVRTRALESLKSFNGKDVEQFFLKKTTDDSHPKVRKFALQHGPNELESTLQCLAAEVHSRYNRGRYSDLRCKAANELVNFDSKPKIRKALIERVLDQNEDKSVRRKAINTLKKVYDHPDVKEALTYILQNRSETSSSVVRKSASAIKEYKGPMAKKVLIEICENHKNEYKRLVLRAVIGLRKQKFSSKEKDRVEKILVKVGEFYDRKMKRAVAITLREFDGHQETIEMLKKWASQTPYDTKESIHKTLRELN